ncbi:helix-turn-helix domain-containing protein [Streptomyces profundus]|uniref:helix-turn-helix domain-containing protein n=1 Tax=Streptomyces profundus TaxID=2867410 RepID=UPI001D160E9D|nr:helix-turn-helix transcriptional regulator [Streptomyces sp. MA3_2.13]UED86153.1 helix-turn-helix domain-containing protein [Streptomyces sp. MA3_2.13]
MSAGRSEPTATQLFLGARLRRMREAAGRSMAEAASALRISSVAMRRLESGHLMLEPAQIAPLLAAYGRAEAADEIQDEVARARCPGWWERYREVLPDWLADYLALEEHAQIIRLYAPSTVPELLQSPGYAKALLRIQHPDDGARLINRRLELLIGRQAALRRTAGRPPSVWALVEEATLRRQVGGPAVMRDQIEHLRGLAAESGFTISVMPLHTAHAALLCGPVQMVRYQPADLADRVLLRTLDGAEVSDRPDVVRQYLMALDSAASVRDSLPITEWIANWEERAVA